MEIPIYSIKLPEYNIQNKPDHNKIGAKIDRLIKKHFLGKKVAIRCLSSKGHKGKNINDLIKIIKTLGHDKYSSRIKGDRYENVHNKKIDIFALDFKISKNGKYMEYFIEPFYEFPIKFKEKPIRLDIVIIYDFFKLKRVLHKYEGREDIKKDGFIFRNQDNKKDALLGIIKIE